LRRGTARGLTTRGARSYRGAAWGLSASRSRGRHRASCTSADRRGRRARAFSARRAAAGARWIAWTVVTERAAGATKEHCAHQPEVLQRRTKSHCPIIVPARVEEPSAKTARIARFLNGQSSHNERRAVSVDRVRRFCAAARTLPGHPLPTRTCSATESPSVTERDSRT